MSTRTDNTEDTSSAPASQNDNEYLDTLLEPLLTAAEQDPRVEMFEKLLAKIDEHSQEPEYKRIFVRLLESLFRSALREDGDAPELSNDLISKIRDATPSLVQEISWTTTARAIGESFGFTNDLPDTADGAVTEAEATGDQSRVDV